MGDNRQILDVTYGTFSCRLEGFDDSVATMKLVADYLQSQPNLTRTQTSIAAADDIDALSALTGGSVDAVTTTEGRAQLLISKHDATPALLEIENQAQNNPPSDFDDEEDDSIAAKLERIRAVVGRTPAPAAADDFAEDVQEHAAQQTETSIQALTLQLDDHAGDTTTVDLAAPFGDDDDLADDAPDLTAQTSPSDASESTMNLASFVAGDDLNLQDEVAQVEREIDDRHKRQELSRTADAAVQRILSQTDNALNAPELRRQRDSFAQLKAASVAIDAARQLGDDDDDDSELNEPYRDDLDEIAAAEAEKASDLDADDVSPDVVAHPMAAYAPDQPVPLPPLRLVASQRVVEPVKPMGDAESRLRQIVSRIEKVGQPMSYADFVASHDVTDLAEMIVAAAAYANFIEMKQDFSRPEIMRLVRAHAKENVARQNVVRIFGQLVKEERIVRLDNGRFQVAPDTQYRPSTKIARG